MKDELITAPETAQIMKCSLSCAYKILADSPQGDASRRADYIAGACPPAEITEAGGIGMSIRDWIGGLLWALPLLAAFEYLTR